MRPHSTWRDVIFGPHRTGTWREFVFEFFGQNGYFSLRPMPMNEAERHEQANQKRAPKDVTRLNLDADQPERGQ